MRWISWTNIVLGLWLVSAGLFFTHASGTTVVEDIITGLLVALGALWADRAYRPRVSAAATWTVVLVGLWIVAAPFALGYERESLDVANDLVIGLAVLALGTVNVVVKGRRISRLQSQRASRPATSGTPASRHWPTQMGGSATRAR